MSEYTVIHAYRHLYRGLLHAVQFAKPARYIVRAQLRKAFTEPGAAKLDQQRLVRTLMFLQAAAREKGIEHTVLKTLIHTAYFRYHHDRDTWKIVQIQKKTINR
ncbi:DUF1763-domain-containing protein [Whalleya microplaca]|nr:DUF1763-domain-containing protein [Whalleya microplaca]